MTFKPSDKITKKWIRNRSDELAVENGCHMDEGRGQFVLDWLEETLCLYEGMEFAGQPLKPMAWQREAFMRLFGWVRWSEKRKRWVRRFRYASIWIPKKNGKSPSLAALGLYLLAGDGEPGNCVYFGAVDGAQARAIAGKHAIEMCRSSDLLMQHCSINKVDMQITFEVNSSILKPLSSSNQKNQKGKEGLNGSILIDETHVVDRAFIKRISRAGISRIEPLMIEVSTAGNDPDGYGFERYQYGKKVEAGDIVDEQLFFIAYEAPQDLTAEQLDADPVKYCKQANPAWGVTIHEEEILADYNRSKNTPADLADFMMYRLNVWQRSASPWLRRDAWMKVVDNSLDIKDFYGSDAVLGLDLSVMHDMSALSLGVRHGDKVALWSWLWIPEDEAHDLRAQVPNLLLWHQQGFLRFTPGATIDQRLIREQINDLEQKFRIHEIRYDPHLGEQMTQEIEEQLGITRVAVRPQYSDTFSSAVDEFESSVYDESIVVAESPVINWMVGNCEISKADERGRRKLVKPDNKSPKKIDGIISMILARSGVASLPESGIEAYCFDVDA